MANYTTSLDGELSADEDPESTDEDPESTDDTDPRRERVVGGGPSGVKRREDLEGLRRITSAESDSLFFGFGLLRGGVWICKPFIPSKSAISWANYGKNKWNL